MNNHLFIYLILLYPSDWCISRQLWWGHQIPIYHCQYKNDSVTICALTEEEALEKACDKFGTKDVDEIKINQDEDVLDTWFSSALVPFANFGWPNQVRIDYDF